jgi:hypothetical protein
MEMTNASVTPWVPQYRAATVDPLTPALDQVILEAARRHLNRRRNARHMVGTSVFGVVAILAASTTWRVHQPGYVPNPVTGYGRVEGISRRYLLEVQTHQFTGFEVTEGHP